MNNPMQAFVDIDFEDPLDATIAVKIIGVTAEYEIDGKRLGLEVVEL